MNSVSLSKNDSSTIAKVILLNKFRFTLYFGSIFLPVVTSYEILTTSGLKFVTGSGFWAKMDDLSHSIVTSSTFLLSVVSAALFDVLPAIACEYMRPNTALSCCVS